MGTMDRIMTKSKVKIMESIFHIVSLVCNTSDGNDELVVMFLKGFEYTDWVKS